MHDSTPAAVRSGNPLGWTGLILAVLGAATLFAAVAWVERFERATDWNLPHQGVGRIGQGIVLMSGCLVGGTLDLVGLILSLFGLRRRPRWPAWIGIALSLAGPIGVVGWWMLVVERRMAG